MPKRHDTTPVEPRPLAANRLPVDSILDQFSTATIAAIMNVTERTVQRWRHNGVTGYTADKLAVKVLGDDPYTVWGRDFERVFAA